MITFLLVLTFGLPIAAIIFAAFWLNACCQTPANEARPDQIFESRLMGK